MTKKISRIIGSIMLVIAIAFVVFALNHPEMSFPWSNTITWVLYGVYAIATVVLLIAPTKKNLTKECDCMKKKLTIAVIVVAVIVGVIFAWRVAYSMQKNTDNIPTLAMVSEMDDASFLVGYRSNQLITVWGEPDEETPTTVGTTILTWKIDDDATLIVHVDSKNKVASYELK